MHPTLSTPELIALVSFLCGVGLAAFFIPRPDAVTKNLRGKIKELEQQIKSEQFFANCQLQYSMKLGEELSTSTQRENRYLVEIDKLKNEMAHNKKIVELHQTPTYERNNIPS